MMESMGLPLPAETCIITAALYSLKTHHLGIEGITAAAGLGAIIGDNLGYLIGRHVGLPLLQKHGAKIGLTADRLLVGEYLFHHHGDAIVFFGRFISVARVFVALLAGACQLRWPRFMLFNALGGTCWAGGYAIGTYILGNQITKLSGTVGTCVGVIGVIFIIGSAIFLKKNEKKLMQRALAEAKTGQFPPA